MKQYEFDALMKWLLQFSENIQQMLVDLFDDLEPKTKDISVINPKECALGTFGIWDYQPKHWARLPKIEEIEEVCRQKRMRLTSNMWKRPKYVQEWLRGLGLLDIT